MLPLAPCPKGGGRLGRRQKNSKEVNYWRAFEEELGRNYGGRKGAEGGEAGGSRDEAD